MIKKLLMAMSMACFIAGSAWAGPFFNEHLPEWVKLDVELRHRVEVKDNFDFNDTVDDDTSYHLWRARVNVALEPVEQFKLFYQFQDSRISHDSISGSKSAYENWYDTRQLYGEIKNFWPFSDALLEGVELRLGRQELSYGAQRLVGGFNWSNVAQTFDAGKAVLRFWDDRLTVEGFGGKKTPTKSPREHDDLFDGSTEDMFSGYYATVKYFHHATIEQYLFNRNTDKSISFGPSGAAHLDEYTIGARVHGKIPETGFDYDLEAAHQWGDFGTLDVDAQMLIAGLGYTIDHEWSPRLAFEFNYASGDDNLSDGERNTFDNLFPTNHLFYGYMDRASLQNINNYRFQLSAKPYQGLKVQLDFHMLYLDTSADSLYHAGRGVVRTASGAADEHVGNELDLLVKYKINEYVGVMGGYSRFFAGDFLEDTGSADDGDFFYLQTVLNF